MKSLKNNLLVFLALGLILTASCKKYPDGPLLSLSSKLERVDGLWDVESYTVDGNDSTTWLKNQAAYGKYLFSKVEPKNMGAAYGAAIPYGKSGYWEFRNKKKDIYVRFDGRNTTPVNLGAYGADEITWEIRRLTNTDLWLKTIYNGKTYFVKFKIVIV